MSADPLLFPPFRRTAPATSREAAQRIADHAGTMEGQVLAFIRSRGLAGATDSEGQAALDLLAQSYTPRRRALVQRGAVVATDRKRATPSGRRAVVWIVAEAAHRPVAVEGGATP
jgi:hypothetical protein